MTLYEILGVEKHATTEEIKTSFKKLAKKFHPNVNPNNPSAESKFKEVSNAYNILSDSQKREQYDAELSGVNGGINFGFGSDIFSNFEELFNPYVRGLGALNVTTRVKIDFLDARHEHSKPIKFIRKNLCKTCDGTGAKSYNGKCPYCQGNGQWRSPLGGIFNTIQICTHCSGTGKQIKEKCLLCQKGQIDETIEVNVTIPAGIMTGKTLRIPGEGNKASRSQGDLLIQVEVSEDLRWERRGANLISKLVVGYPTLVLGGEAEIETIWGKEKVYIPPGTKANSLIPLYQKGFPVLNTIMPGERGVHNVILELLVPQNISDPKFRELLHELRKYS